MTMLLDRPPVESDEPELSPRVRAVVDKLLAEDALGAGLEAGIEDAINSTEILPEVMVHVCMADDVDERVIDVGGLDLDEAQDACDPTRIPTLEREITRTRLMVRFGLLDARGLAMSTLETLVFTMFGRIGCRKARDLGILTWYAHDRAADGHGGGGKKVPIPDIDAFVNMWVEAIVLMGTSHSHQGYTDADQQSDALLGPMLRAPIAEIREWATKLGERLENDERVPFLIWSGFRRAIQPLIMSTPAGAALELKTTLAREVAELAEAQLDSAEMVAAIAGALQWRQPKELEKVKAELKSGTRPRITGGQSCLFLSVGAARVVL